MSRYSYVKGQKIKRKIKPTFVPHEFKRGDIVESLEPMYYINGMYEIGCRFEVIGLIDDGHRQGLVLVEDRDGAEAFNCLSCAFRVVG